MCMGRLIAIETSRSAYELLGVCLELLKKFLEFLIVAIRSYVI